MTIAFELPLLDTESVSTRYREKGIRQSDSCLLITDLRGSQQEQDLSEPINCDGLGRIRHFRRSTSVGWPQNPLPIDPACRFLQIPTCDTLRVQVFQNAVCNWRCWYCFVPFNLLAAHPKHSRWVTANELIEVYLREKDRPLVIDLSGGQPDLIPEWVPWTMKAIREHGLEGSMYLWSDDNLSNDYFWKYLSEQDLNLIRSFRGYGRVGCFKGFDAESFAFNTAAHPTLFDQQFTIFQKFVEFGFDIYAYATLTTPNAENLRDRIACFVDSLQKIAPLLPLRVIPLEVQVFTPVVSRLSPIRQESMVHQNRAIEIWNRELESRFSLQLRETPVTEIKLEPLINL